MPERIGFVGLGNMGHPMTSRLVGAGHAVQAFDVAEAARARAVEAGATEATTLAAAADGADLVILMLPNSDIVEQVAGDDAFLGALPAGATVIDMSSSE